MASLRQPFLLTEGLFRREDVMSVWWICLTAGATLISGLVARWMVLRFLYRIYESGGADDLKVAAEALRRTRSWTVVEKFSHLRRRRDE
jgi:hypothetical protein